MKIITVIIPCYNVEKYMDRCLCSIENQTIGLDRLEIICIDDGSTDRTFEILTTWEQKYPENILLIKHAKNSGQSTSRNSGLSYASCDYLAFIDADDWIDAAYLEKMYHIAVTENCDVVQCGYVRDTQDSYTNNNDSVASFTQGHIVNLDSPSARKKAITDKALSSNAPMKLIRRNLLTDNEITFNDGLRYEDIAFGLLLTMYSQKVSILDESLYHYYVNANSTVLKKNEVYHLDLLKNWEILWNELEERGFFPEYKDELELEFVYSCVMIFWKILAFRFDEPPYSYYELLSNLARGSVPGIMDNPYIKGNSLSELHMLLLKCCLNTISPEEFDHIIKNIRKIGL